MPHVIAQPCIGTKNAACTEVCPVDCIHSTDDDDQYFIDPEACIDCGVCVEVCPVAAIFFEDELPEPWLAFAQLNAAFYQPPVRAYGRLLNSGDPVQRVSAHKHVSSRSAFSRECGK
jgi:NAD-dependent dihydropyrimidine dehydrogenase PreA subunit